jgi:NADH:ubiquinone oxidoreductase subunit E
MNKKIILICNSTQPKQSHEAGCLANGSDEILTAFQQKIVQEQTDLGQIEIKGTACMNNCGNAICGRIFPGTRTYQQLSLDVVDEIWESHIKKNQEVKTLLAPKINRFLGF